MKMTIKRNIQLENLKQHAKFCGIHKNTGNPLSQGCLSEV